MIDGDYYQLAILTLFQIVKLFGECLPQKRPHFFPTLFNAVRFIHIVDLGRIRRPKQLQHDLFALFFSGWAGAFIRTVHTINRDS